MKNKEVAKAIILAYLEIGMTPDGLYSIYEIRDDNNELLLEHVKALKNIFEKAIEEIENDKGTH